MYHISHHLQPPYHTISNLHTTPFPTSIPHHTIPLFPKLSTDLPQALAYYRHAATFVCGFFNFVFFFVNLFVFGFFGFGFGFGFGFDFVFGFSSLVLSSVSSVCLVAVLSSSSRTPPPIHQHPPHPSYTPSSPSPLSPRPSPSTPPLPPLSVPPAAAAASLLPSPLPSPLPRPLPSPLPRPLPRPLPCNHTPTTPPIEPTPRFLYGMYLTHLPGTLGSGGGATSAEQFRLCGLRLSGLCGGVTAQGWGQWGWVW
ncbi:hypothetical protein EV368DRAFT_90320 [Lentinula lateritia]|nr:hypothetical protein EV368DRAFT_90320 [Lentinula lateritia]